MKFFFNNGLDPLMYFYRDKSREVDLLVKHSGKMFAIEIKSAKTFHESFLDNLHYYEKIMPESSCLKKILIYDGDLDQRRGETEILPYKSLNNFLKTLHL